MRKMFWLTSFGVLGTVALIGFFWPPIFYTYVLLVPIFLVGVKDCLQTRHSILKNFPVMGHFRYLLEMIRPEIQQYFIESYEEGKPFSRAQRSVIYQRAKRDLDTLPFGSQLDMYSPGYEWINHSMVPKPMLHDEPRVKIGNEQCSKPYSASLFNVSAMSYGALSKNAVMALNRGAKLGSFYHNTGEGGLSPYHLQEGGDLVWQIGTGYFSCRTKDGKFNPEMFKERATLENVKMIELKMSQGAKPGHGGILPAAKVSREIAAIRGVEVGKTVFSPPYHTAFKTPVEMMEFLQKLRELSGGKPVGFKFCVGKRRELFSVIKAMKKTKIYPDFITVDGGEGGTGAAPIEFSNSVGTPLNDGLIFVHNALVGTGIRDKIKIIVSGKVITGFNILSKIALGADLCNSARGMMFALGCIQALRCNSNHCPAGVATQDKGLMGGLDPTHKATRVFNYHKTTIESFLEVLAAAGLSHPSELRPWHIHRRESFSSVRHYGEAYDYLAPGSLLDGKVPGSYHHAWENSQAEVF